ncbi:MAG: coniferyl aldehyde dehydrogenase [Ideonella sp.]|nr:coniferyl aldehyde dehydrogenase [Ideonella sp.]
MTSHETASAAIAGILAAQRAAFIAEGAVTAEVRRGRLQRAIDALVANNDALCEAMRDDFGGRPLVFSMMNDVLGAIASLKAARDHFEAWMGDQPRASVAPFDNFGATAWLRLQPKGSIGVIGTWNAPLFTLFAPLASIFAAGNRAVLKPSELAPRTAEVVARMVGATFDPTELAVVTGGPEVAAAFSAQPWDHLVFTGSTAVGRQVMKAAAEHLVPVTLELGGKSPVLIGRSADIANAAERIAVGKAQNSGQLCVSPDTVWVPEERLDAFVEAVRGVYAGLYPTIAGNPDVTPAVNDRHFARVESYVAEAGARGARVVMAGEFPSAIGTAQRRVPLRLILNAPADAEISRQEIFGAAMLIRPYRELRDAVAAINAGERPLALYYFGNDAAEQAWVLDHTLSGGVAVNDVLMHAALHDAPFGGVGASGMGHYHGREGFLEFSHLRSVYQAGSHDPRREWGMLPPYSEAFGQMLRAALTP